MAIDIKETIDELPTKTKEELNKLENQIRLNNEVKESIIRGLPIQLRSKHSNEMLMDVDFLDPNFSTALNQIPKENRSDYVYNATLLKESYGGVLSDAEALQYIVQGKKEPDIFLETLLGNNDTYFILDSMFKAINSGKDPFNETIIPTNIIFANSIIVGCIEYIDDENRVLNFENLPQDIQDTLLRGLESKYKDLFKDSISNSLKANPNTSAVSLFDDKEIFELYVKYYNVQHYGETPINYEFLSNKDKQKLQKSFNAELYLLGYNIDVDDDSLKELEERNKRIREENQKRMEEFKRRNKRINGKFHGEKPNPKTNSDQIESTDIQNASGVDIAKSLGLGKQLSQRYISDVDNFNDLEKEQFNKMTFSIARSKFIESHSNLKNYITIDTMRNLYDTSSNTIKDVDDVAWNKLKKIFRDQPKELEQIYTQLLTFPFEVNNTKEDLQKNNKFLNNLENENKNNKAIGTVIDNVRDIFSGMSDNLEGDVPMKQLKFRDNEPIKLIGNNLIIYGTFNGANITLRYDLGSGELFMNSFLQHDGNTKIIIGNTDIANYKIGQLETFDSVLKSHSNKEGQQKLGDNKVSQNHNPYNNLRARDNKNKTFEPFLTQINLIEDAIIAGTEKQSERNSVITNFMKTFNIILDTQEDKSIDFNDGSNLFDLLQIIENSEPSVLANFQNFMRRIMEYSGLKWGANNILGSQKNEKTDITFNENNKNKYITLVRDSAKSFSKNPNIFKGKVNFESGSQLNFVRMIIENITNDASKPNWKLDAIKMRNFLYHLENDGKES